MKKLIIITFFLLTILYFTSCSKIEPIKNKENSLNNTKNSRENIIENTIEVYENKNCGIISCESKEKLKKDFEEGKLNLPDLEFYKDWLKTLLVQYPSKDKIIESENFKKFVDKLNFDFFGCEGNIYECKGTNPYGNDSTNYLFYVFIPELVINNNLEEKGWSEGEIETLIQSIKRKDFDSLYVKELKLLKYKEKIDKIIGEIEIEKIDKEKLKNDSDYFEKIILNPNTGIHDKIISNIYSINIDWEEEGQMEEIVSYTTKSFFNLLSKIGINKEQLIKKIYEIYSYDSEIDLIENIDNDLKNKLKDNQYLFSNMFPNDRYFRNDELYIFKNQEMFNNDNINNFLLYIRHRVLLLFIFGQEENLYNLINRISQYDFEQKFLLTNTFKYSKYIKIEKIIIP